jgi:septal ring factor EnvC (AmiA/AmiB activator)
MLFVAVQVAAAQSPAPAATDPTNLTEASRFRERIAVLRQDLETKQVQLADLRAYAQNLEAEVARLKEELAKKK